MVVSENVDFKRNAIRIRRLIEQMSSMLWASAVGSEISSISANHVERRLVLIAAHVSDADRLPAFRAARKAGHAYKETSDVLHGRFAAVHFNASRVGEWEADVQRLSAIMETCPRLAR